MADNLMENCQKRCYPVCGVVDKRGCGTEYEGSAWPPLPLPAAPELTGGVVHGEGPNLRSAQITPSGWSPPKWWFHRALVILPYFPPAPFP